MSDPADGEKSEPPTRSITIHPSPPIDPDAVWPRVIPEFHWQPSPAIFNLLPLDLAASGSASWISAMMPDFQSSIFHAVSPKISLIGQRASQNLIASLWPSLADLGEKMQAAIEHGRNHFPPNLWATELEFEEIVRLAEQGLPVAWVPNEEILHALAAETGDHARRRLYARYRDELLDESDRILEDMTAAVVEPHRPFAVKAIAALRDGHEESAQALATAMIDGVLHDAAAIIGMKLGKIKNPPDGRHDPKQESSYLFAVQMWSIVRQTDGSNPVPTSAFSRHHSAHRATDLQYSPENAVIAVVHIVSALRLLDDVVRSAEG